MQMVHPITPSTGPFPSPPLDPRAAKILARTMYKDMVLHGLSSQQILAVASELIAQVTAELKQSQDDPGQA
ncbi:MAG: hypothetical protein IT384_17230 [Deltaproteobacteria bacterium]|nr:hypothetical protein [Deltaproteobacteria bacterium]